MNFSKFVTVNFLFFTLVCNAKVLQLTSMDEFNQQVINSKKTAVVKVGATWCHACVSAKKPFENISNDPQFSDVVFVEIDADKSPDIVNKYSVQSLPTFIYFNDGQKIESTAGFSANFKNELTGKVTRMKSAAAPANGQQPVVEKKTEEMAVDEAVTTAETEEAAATCPHSSENFLTRAYNAVNDFFTSIADTIRGWFR